MSFGSAHGLSPIYALRLEKKALANSVDQDETPHDAAAVSLLRQDVPLGGETRAAYSRPHGREALRVFRVSQAVLAERTPEDAQLSPRGGRLDVSSNFVCVITITDDVIKRKPPMVHLSAGWLRAAVFCVMKLHDDVIHD
ncbi:hypothetical protein DPMN_021634 [Dreissena polymorpha]|uniref:Uncharacterized protein n=1 Tax=Dreissena polymorpha TaxID=45954 RepID=A0A9D4NN42_DREPO|nr:hypothetical protein DPMN_021634 [Dreissena polymorpha]